MAFVTVEDLTSSVELIVFPNAYQEVKDKIEQDTVIKASGKISTKDRDGHKTDEPKVLVDNIEVLSEETLANYKPTGKKIPLPKQKKSSTQDVQSTEKRLFIYAKDVNDHDKLVSIKKLVSKYAGSTETILVIESDDGKHAVKLPFKNDASSDLINALNELLGDNCVVLK